MYNVADGNVMIHILFFGLFLYKTIDFTVASGHIPTHEIWVYKWYEVSSRYCIVTTLLVKIHILYTQKWAAGCNPPLQMAQAFVTNICV